MSKEPEHQFETIGHHVCKDTGADDVKKGAPFASTRKDKFLGDGYYFWEDNLMLAKDWGGKTYLVRSIPYCVAEFKISCNFSTFYDLVGNRSHQKHLVSVRKILARSRQELHGWPIGKIIEFLRAANHKTGALYDAFRGQFPYDVIRAADSNYPFSKDTVNFVSSQPGFSELNPCYVICVIDIKKVVLGPIRLVHASKPV